MSRAGGHDVTALRDCDQATEQYTKPASDLCLVALVALMFLGRVGPVTLASSLTLRSTSRDYRLPEGRPMIG